MTSTTGGNEPPVDEQTYGLGSDGMTRREIEEINEEALRVAHDEAAARQAEWTKAEKRLLADINDPTGMTKAAMREHRKWLAEIRAGKAEIQENEDSITFRIQKTGSERSNKSLSAIARFKSETGYKQSELPFAQNFVLQGLPDWSRGFPVYDLLPKFFFGSDRDARKDTQNSRERKITIGKHTYNVTALAGRVIRYKKDGSAADVICRWPSEREEVVSRALRYLVAQKNAKLSHWTHGQKSHERVAFSIGQIATVLSEWGHAHNHSEIDESLKLLADAKIEVKKNAGEAVFAGHLISEYYATAGAERVVVLNSMEADALQREEYLALNISRTMALSTPLARAIRERMVLLFRNAPGRGEAGKAWSFTLTDLVQGGIIEETTRPDRNAKRIKAALDEMTGEGKDIEKFKAEPIYGTSEKGRKPIVDWKYSVWPTQRTADEIINGNTEKHVRQDPVLKKHETAMQQRLSRLGQHPDYEK